MCPPHEGDPTESRLDYNLLQGGELSKFQQYVQQYVQSRTTATSQVAILENVMGFAAVAELVGNFLDKNLPGYPCSKCIAVCGLHCTFTGFFHSQGTGGCM